MNFIKYIFRGIIYALLISLIQAWDSIQEMNADFEKRFAKEDSLSLDEWLEALPNDAERKDVYNLVDFLLVLDSFKGLSASVILAFYPEIKKSMNLTFYKDDYAVISEQYDPNDDLPFKRYFGYVVIASKKVSSLPYLHHSSPHFESDGNVCNESAAIFEQTYGRTLVIAGASRYAVKERASNPCQGSDAIADSAHNNLTMFHTFNSAILAAIKRQESNALANNYFLQWHGMSEKSCPKSPMLISAGASGNHSIYLNASLAANKLKEAYGDEANTPFLDPNCNLAATTNVFGRLIYGVDASEVCYSSAEAENINGHFIHIEQKSKGREDWSGWTEAVKRAFDIQNHHCFIELNKTKC